MKDCSPSEGMPKRDTVTDVAGDMGADGPMTFDPLTPSRA